MKFQNYIYSLNKISFCHLNFVTNSSLLKIYIDSVFLCRQCGNQWLFINIKQSLDTNICLSIAVYFSVMGKMKFSIEARY